jgi:hypothetical protein
MASQWKKPALKGTDVDLNQRSNEVVKEAPMCFFVLPKLQAFREKN